MHSLIVKEMHVAGIPSILVYVVAPTLVAILLSTDLGIQFYSYISITPILYVALIIIYPLTLHILFKFKGNATDGNYERISIYFETSKKIFIGITCFLVLLIVMDRLNLMYGFLGNYTFQDKVFAVISVTFTFSTAGIGLGILSLVAKKHFRFYLARGYCLSATKKEDEFEKSRYLFSTLDSYNKFLRQHSQIEIKDIKRIYTSFLMADNDEKNQMIKSIYQSLEGDKLKLARYLLSVYKSPKTEFFAGESLVQKLKIVGTVLAGNSYRDIDNPVDNEFF